MKRVAVIPAYNEEATIATVVLLAKPHVDVVLVIDDGSTDRTAHLAEAAGARVVRLAFNQGKGAALRAGFAAAATERAGAVVTLDADFQHDPADLPALLSPVLRGEATVAIGSRRTSAGARSGIPIVRRIGQRIMSWAGRKKVSDTESGLRAYAASVLAGLRIDERGYGADWEILQRAIVAGARVVEVPVRVRYAERAQKVHPARHGVSLLAAVIRYARTERPLLLFGTFGGLLLLSCALAGGKLAFDGLRDGDVLSAGLIMAAIGGVLGVVLIVAGLVLDAIALRGSVHD